LRRLALFDLDGTLTRGDTFQWFVWQLLRAHPARWPRALPLPVLLAGYLLRLLDRGALKGGILHLLFGGLSREHIAARARSFAADIVPARMFPEAVAALREHVAAGDHVVLLSASPDLYVPEIGHLLGAHQSICSRVRWNQDRLDGRLSGPNRRDREKTRVLETLRAAHPGLPVIAYGNSVADLDHMFQCEEAVFVNPHPRLVRRLQARMPAMRLVRWA
jgi:HAD superfamily hydrolase (TIGR01490 family)